MNCFDSSFLQSTIYCLKSDRRNNQFNVCGFEIEIMRLIDGLLYDARPFLSFDTRDICAYLFIISFI